MSKKEPKGDQPAIEVHGLVKVYGGNRALDGIDLTVQRGQVFGFLGPNGAGKTTTVHVLATLTRPDRGTARVLGHDLLGERDAIRARVAVTGQFAALDEDLTGHENLTVLGRLHGLGRAASRRRADDLLAAFDLTGVAGRPVGGYSGGTRRRLDIAAGLIVTPDLLFLDEPTTGLDPRGAAACGSWSAASPRPGPPCSSPPSTSTRPTSSPTGSRSSTRAGSWPRGPARS